MGRNLYILAGTVALLGLLAIGLSLTHLTQQPGTPNDAMLWRTTGIVLICVASVSALGGVLSTLFEQAERRAAAERESARRKRRES